MHLLSAREASPDDVTEAVDLEQTPGDIVILSMADTELACLAAAHSRLDQPKPSLRLANPNLLQHPYSVDLYIERTLAQAKYVIVRLLGGRSYWRYGIEQIEQACSAGSISLVLLSGDDGDDPDLRRHSTISDAGRRRLWHYLDHGGLANAENLLRFLASELGHDAIWLEPAPLPKAGRYDPGIDQIGDRPGAAIVFYRALVQGGDLTLIDALSHSLDRAGLQPVPIYVAGLKQAEAAAITEQILLETQPAIIMNMTGFAVSTPGSEQTVTPFSVIDTPVLQLVCGSGDEAGWRSNSNGLGPRDLAMSVALPEIDGRVLTRAVSFKDSTKFNEQTQSRVTVYKPVSDRVAFVADLAAAWVRLRRTETKDRRIALVMANYPTRDGRLANGVGLDTPASIIELFRALGDDGYSLAGAPENAASLMDLLQSGPTNELAPQTIRQSGVTLGLDDYREHLEALPQDARSKLEERWGKPEADPHVQGGAFQLALHRFGNVVIGIQPARGYNVDPVATYHAPDLVPPHSYLAFYFWLRHAWGTDAIVHVGKHGNLEWLPGKALALSENCWPEIALGPLPHLYPFIVNDPGEGSQAKRRSSAVIIDHLTPPLTRAEAYGPLRELEQLVDEYYEALNLDPRRLDYLRGEIVDTSRRLGLERDLGIDVEADDFLGELDNHLCELKELQIRDGLHILGVAPSGQQRTDLACALVRIPRGAGEGPNESILRALAADLDLEADPLSPELAAPWDGPQPDILGKQCGDPWRTLGDTVERLEMLTASLIAGDATVAAEWQRTAVVMRHFQDVIAPKLDRSGKAEIAGLLTGLDGRFVQPGPSGAPTRGRLDVLPTGRNFYSIDTRAVPTPAAWHLGWRSAQSLVEYYMQSHGEWPKRIALSAWGTANMRTGGDDIAQTLALLGCRPVWDATSQRVTGVEIMPLGVLGRPRVDVTLRVSGFFRDAFPEQMALIDDAVRAVSGLDEPEAQNPIAAAVRRTTASLIDAGTDENEARRQASYRVFGSKPGAYGAGLQALIDEGGWQDDKDLASAFMVWSGYAYGRALDGKSAGKELEQRLAAVELVIHNQDNREHDILDSDDYYQFQGGLAAAVRVSSGTQPEIYLNDHSRPETPRIRTLKHEIGRVVRGRAANPKWIRGVMRHGYKGAFEIAATVDYLFAYAATARIVEHHHFDALFDAYLGDEEVRNFIAENNPSALIEIAERFREAIDRELWHPKRNDTSNLLDVLARRGQSAVA